MKKVLSFLCICMVLIASFSCGTVAAEGDIRVFVDGKEVTFDVPPQIIDGRTMVPIRAIFEAMGATVVWSDADQTATSVRGDTTALMILGKTVMYVNGDPVYMDVSPVIIDSRTLAPARYVAESFGATVVWDAQNRYVDIYDETSAPNRILYAADGRTIKVPADEVDEYLAVGWFLTEEAAHMVTLYADDGRTIEVAESDVPVYLAVGWYRTQAETQQTLYAADGRTIMVQKSEVPAYLAVGWYESAEAARAVTLYADDGRTIEVAESDVPAYLAVGWYRTQAETQQTLYAADGRTITVYRSEVPSYLAVGWYTSQSGAQASVAPSSGSSSQGSGTATTGSGTVYVTPSGKKYHYSWCPTIQNSKKLTAMSTSQAIQKGYGACKVCH